DRSRSGGARLRPHPGGRDGVPRRIPEDPDHHRCRISPGEQALSHPGGRLHRRQAPLGDDGRGTRPAARDRRDHHHGRASRSRPLVPQPLPVITSPVLPVITSPALPVITCPVLPVINRPETSPENRNGLLITEGGVAVVAAGPRPGEPSHSAAGTGCTHH